MEIGDEVTYIDGWGNKYDAKVQQIFLPEKGKPILNLEYVKNRNTKHVNSVQNKDDRLENADGKKVACWTNHKKVEKKKEEPTKETEEIPQPSETPQ